MFLFTYVFCQFKFSDKYFAFISHFLFLFCYISIEKAVCLLSGGKYNEMTDGGKKEKKRESNRNKE
jgi:hypothetical protein